MRIYWCRKFNATQRRAIFPFHAWQIWNFFSILHIHSLSFFLSFIAFSACFSSTIFACWFSHSHSRKFQCHIMDMYIVWNYTDDDNTDEFVCMIQIKLIMDIEFPCCEENSLFFFYFLPRFPLYMQGGERLLLPSTNGVWSFFKWD